MPNNPVILTPVDMLIPFTGFYALEGRSGAFVLIDTNLVYVYTPGTGGAAGTAAMVNQATVSISMNGVALTEYAFPQSCTFDGQTLTVTDDGKPVASLLLSKDHSGGNVSSLAGTITGQAVSGKTPFNPIPLPLFAAEYYESASQPGLDEPRLRIQEDFSVHYRPSDAGGFVRVERYGYNYAMFVIEFVMNGQKTTFEMGTTPTSGKVAGNAGGGGLLVSIIPPQA